MTSITEIQTEILKEQYQTQLDATPTVPLDKLLVDIYNYLSALPDEQWSPALLFQLQRHIKIEYAQVRNVEYYECLHCSNLIYGDDGEWFHESMGRIFPHKAERDFEGKTIVRKEVKNEIKASGN